MQSGLSMDFFEGPWPKSSTHVLEKCFIRNPDFVFCSSVQSLRLGSMNLERHIIMIHRDALIIL
jgi:hypothetical protein